MVIAWKHLPCAQVSPHKDTEGETQTPESLHYQHIKPAFGAVLCSAIQFTLDSKLKKKRAHFSFFKYYRRKGREQGFYSSNDFLGRM